MVSDFEILKKLDWSGWCLSNAIYARFQGNQIKYENPEEEKKARLTEQCIMSSCSRFSAIDNAVCASVHGDLYLFRFPSMYLDKSQIAGFSIDKLKKPDMALSRGYSGHTSMILSTEVSFQGLYSIDFRRQVRPDNFPQRPVHHPMEGGV